MIAKQDAEFLLGRPEFLRFLYSVIQSAGMVGQTASADGRTVRDLDLSWFEGRRSLGHEILLMIEQGQPDALRSPDGLPAMTIAAVLREAINPKEKPRDHRNRSASDRDPDDDDRTSR